MKIEYDNDSVRELFEDLEQVQGSKGLMRKKIGLEMTKAIKKRINQLKAADNFSIYLSTGLGKPHPLINTNGMYGVNITANYRLIIKPISEDLSPEKLKKCKIVEIEGVVDYHGKGKNSRII